MGRLTLAPFMVELEHVHAKMMATMAPFPLGDLILVVPPILAYCTRWSTIPVNGRKVRVLGRDDCHNSCYLVSEQDYQENLRACDG